MLIRFPPSASALPVTVRRPTAGSWWQLRPYRARIQEGTANLPLYRGTRELLGQKCQPQLATSLESLENQLCSSHPMRSFGVGCLLHLPHRSQSGPTDLAQGCCSRRPIKNSIQFQGCRIHTLCKGLLSVKLGSVNKVLTYICVCVGEGVRAGRHMPQLCRSQVTTCRGGFLLP